MRLILCVLLTMCIPVAARAQQAAPQNGSARAAEVYPSRPVQLMISSSKGGGADISFRVLAAALEPVLGQKIEIVNKPANGAAEGLAALAKAKPDGYTLGGVWNGPLTASPQVRALPYTVDSFDTVASVYESDYAVCARKDFPAETGPALVALLREKPLGYTYSNEGRGGAGYFAGERLFEALGVLVRSENYDGSGEAAKNFLAGAVDLYVGTVPAIQAHIKSGSVKCLIVLSTRRPDILRQAATTREIGAEGTEAALWRMIIAPKGLPKDRRAKLEAGIRKAMAAPSVQAFLAAQGERALADGGPETMARLKKEFAAFSDLTSRLGVKSE